MAKPMSDDLRETMQDSLGYHLMKSVRIARELGIVPSDQVAQSTDEVGSPVELCPCCCSNDDGVTFYSCDGYGNPLEGDPANCASLNKDTYVDDEHELEPEDWSRVTLPNTGGR